MLNFTQTKAMTISFLNYHLKHIQLRQEKQQYLLPQPQRPKMKHQRRQGAMESHNYHHDGTTTDEREKKEPKRR
jgi:hypothetical protein